MKKAKKTMAVDNDPILVTAKEELVVGPVAAYVIFQDQHGRRCFHRFEMESRVAQSFRKGDRFGDDNSIKLTISSVTFDIIELAFRKGDNGESIGEISNKIMRDGIKAELDKLGVPLTADQLKQVRAVRPRS